MAIIVSLQYNGGLLPDIIVLTLCYNNIFAAYDPTWAFWHCFPPVWDAQNV